MDSPSLVVLGGPNGAGKTTTAPELLRGALAVSEFVNADAIAQGLSGFRPEGAAIEAGRIMLGRLKQLAARRDDFAFESTLASRNLAFWIRDLLRSGYGFHLVFLWLPNADLAVARVAERVRRGGHGVPEETIRRRYTRGLRNFNAIYRPLATSWRLYDNSQSSGARLAAIGGSVIREEIKDKEIWREVTEASL